jgi:hypothetical protein
MHEEHTARKKHLVTRQESAHLSWRRLEAWRVNNMCMHGFIQIPNRWFERPNPQSRSRPAAGSSPFSTCVLVASAASSHRGSFALLASRQQLQHRTVLMPSLSNVASVVRQPAQRTLTSSRIEQHPVTFRDGRGYSTLGWIKRGRTRVIATGLNSKSIPY